MRVRSTGLAAVIAVAGFGVTACGGEPIAPPTVAAGSPIPDRQQDGESIEPPTVAASSTSSTAPSPNALTLAEAKAILEPLFNARRDAVGRLNKAGDADSFSMKRLNRAAENQADAEDNLVRALVARDWPLEIRPEIERLINALNESQPVLSQLSETEDFDQYLEFFDAYLQPIATEVPSAVRAIEVKLGIAD